MRRLVLGGLLVVVVAWLTWRFVGAPRESEMPAGALSDSVRVGLKSVRLYFAATNGDSLVGEARELPEIQGLHERVAALVSELSRGPSGRGVGLMPSGTSVLHVYLDDRGLMTLDLSRAFQQSFRGGSTAEFLAVGALLRTLGANIDGVRRVQLTCAGATLKSLGGHLPLDRPIDIAELR